MHDRNFLRTFVHRKRKAQVAANTASTTESLRSTRFYNSVHELIFLFFLFFIPSLFVRHRDEVDRITCGVKERCVLQRRFESIPPPPFLFAFSSFFFERGATRDRISRYAVRPVNFLFEILFGRPFTRNMLFYRESFLGARDYELATFVLYLQLLLLAVAFWFKH